MYWRRRLQLAAIVVFVIAYAGLSHYSNSAAKTHDLGVGLALGPHSLGLSQPGVSKHLKVLRDAGLVEVRPDGKQRWYGLRAQPLAELDEWLLPYREYWSGRLDALETHLEENPS